MFSSSEIDYPSLLSLSGKKDNEIGRGTFTFFEAESGSRVPRTATYVFGVLAPDPEGRQKLAGGVSRR